MKKIVENQIVDYSILFIVFILLTGIFIFISLSNVSIFSLIPIKIINLLGASSSAVLAFLSSIELIYWQNVQDETDENNEW